MTFRFMVLNTTFNNILIISWRSVLLVEETGLPGENHRPVASHWQTLSHIVVSSTPLLSGIRTHNLVVVGTNYIGCCTFIYHAITTTTDQWHLCCNSIYILSIVTSHPQFNFILMFNEKMKWALNKRVWNRMVSLFRKHRKTFIIIPHCKIKPYEKWLVANTSHLVVSHVENTAIYYSLF